MLKTVAILAILLPQTAWGLSCARSNFGEEFNRIAAAKELYSLGYGELRATEDVPTYERGQSRRVAYEFTGRVNFGRGKEARSVVVQTTCAASWCGDLPKEGAPVVIFMEHKDDALEISATPCRKDYFEAPTLGQVGALRKCLSAGICKEKEIAAFE